jgi:hypothetical protein
MTASIRNCLTYLLVESTSLLPDHGLIATSWHLNQHGSSSHLASSQAQERLSCEKSHPGSTQQGGGQHIQRFVSGPSPSLNYEWSTPASHDLVGPKSPPTPHPPFFPCRPNPQVLKTSLTVIVGLEPKLPLGRRQRLLWQKNTPIC